MALLHVRSELDIDKAEIGLINLPLKSKTSYRGRNCIATGWGRRGFGKINMGVIIRENKMSNSLSMYRA